MEIEYFCRPSQEDIRFCRKLQENINKDQTFEANILDPHTRIETIKSWADSNNLNFDKDATRVMKYFVDNDIENGRSFVREYIRRKTLYDKAPCNIAVPCGERKGKGKIRMLGQRSRKIANNARENGGNTL